jgi:hypothetical protein
MQELSWTGIGQFDSDGDALAEGLDLGNRYETCRQCITRNAADPVIKRLRRESGVQS